jgi:YD repeat-containing protein
MKKLIITGLILFATALSQINAQTINIQFASDLNGRLMGYNYTGLFIRSFVYDKSGNRVAQTDDDLSTEIFENKTGHSFLYPNPFRRSFSVILENHKEAVREVYLTNMLGQLVPIDKQAFQGKLSISTKQEIPPGFYLCRVLTEREIIKFKIIKR